MSEKKIYEIMSVLSDRQNLEKDFEEAFSLVSGHFRGKYLERLDSAFKKCRKQYEQNPSKEVQLMRALKPFLPQERQRKLDDITEMFTLLATFENIRKEAVQLAPQAAEFTSGAEGAAEGIYERFMEPAPMPMPMPAEANIAWEALPDPAIHEDGIYEVDEHCMYRKNQGLGAGGPNIAGLMLIMGLSRAGKMIGE